MDDLDVLARDFGFNHRGKSNPMRTESSERRSVDDRRSRDGILLDDVFGGPPKYASSLSSNAGNSNNKRSSLNDFDYDSIFKSSEPKNSNSKTTSFPVYDKPVYDEDIFDGVPGLKSKPAAPVMFDDDVFATISSPPLSKSRNQNTDFNDLAGNYVNNEKSGLNNDRSAKSSSSSRGFDDLLAGFRSVSSAAENRPMPDSSRASIPTGGSNNRSNMPGDPFVVLESTSNSGSSSRAFTGQMGETTKLGKSRSAKPEASSSSGGTFSELDPRKGNSSFRYTDKKVPVNNFEEPPSFNVPNATNFKKPSGQTDSPQHNETSSHVGMGQQFDDIWLTVSEIPLFTLPTPAPPPSRPPPPIPRPISRKRADDFSSHSHSPKPTRPSVKSPPASRFSELEDFAMGKSRNGVDESDNEVNAFTAAAAMKDAMDKAEAKFKHAKEVREREHVKAARNREFEQLEKDGPDGLEKEKELRETRERLEQIRIEREKERSRDIEREKSNRQAVERATREARERAAAEARVKAERVAVDKANAEARERAERAVVQRAQNEARERAAAEAKGRAEKAAAEARERARAEDESRRRNERAAAEARETAAKMSQQNNDNDLESFFSMGRASSAPRARENSNDTAFNQQFQNKGGSEATKKPSSSSGPSSNFKKASSSTNIVDDLSSIFGAAPSSGDFYELEGETEERRRARIHRDQRTQERTAKALAEKNQRDLQAQREQEERHRISGTLDTEIKRWAAGKEGNLRALLSTLQYVLWPECGWQAVSLTDLIMGASVKKVYRKATLCVHPDKVQQRGATLQQKYIAEKVFDLLKEAWNKFNSEELF